MSESRTFQIEGMSCEHCVAAVSGALSALPGVEEVEVDLAAGTAVVSGAVPDEDAVSEALEEAGYELA